MKLLVRAMVVCALLTAGAYVAYTLFAENLALFDPRDLVWTIPMVAFGLWLSSDDKFSFPSLLALLFVWFIIKTVFVYLAAWLFH